MVTKAECPICEGHGDIIVGGQQEGPCTHCRTLGAVDVGVFELRCERHCTQCEGLDHHWSYDGHQDFEENPLMICRHCSALRPATDEEDAEAGAVEADDVAHMQRQRY